MKTLLVVALLIFAAGINTPAYGEPLHDADATPMNAPNDAAGILQSSHDPGELLRVATQLAGSSKASEQHVLSQALTSDNFLLRLNTAEEYNGQPKRLRLSRIIDELRRNPSAVSRATLLALTQSPTFIQQGGRVDLLLAATAVIRPAPPELVAFWDRHSQPEDGFTPLTIHALIENGSEPALHLFEKKLADPRHEDDFKLDWMHSEIMPHRNSLAVLVSCDRLLHGGLPTHLRGDLVESLFDYRPGIWFTPASNHLAPTLASYSPEARAEWRKLGLFAIEHVTLTPSQRAAVEATLKLLGKD
ncbi:MAG: hypothetical protein ABI178_11650 [Rhodanobacter sp.]